MDGGSGGGAADFLLKLYRIGRTVGPCGFQDAALRLIAGHLPFDLGIWAMGKPDGQIHGVRHYHHTPHLRAALLPYKSSQMLLHLLGSLPAGNAVNLGEDMTRNPRPARPAKKSRAVLSRHHACGMVLHDPETDLHHLFMFIRTRERERVLSTTNARG